MAKINSLSRFQQEDEQHDMKLAETEIKWEIMHPPLNILDLSINDIGKTVTYYPKRSTLTESLKYKQTGYITSFNAHVVFVCFDETGRGQGCYPEDLRYE